MRSFLAAALIAGATPLWAEAPRVVTDIPPVHSLTAMVMAGVGTPALLLPPGGSTHGHQLRPSEAAELSQASVLFWIGPNLSPWLEEARGTLAAGVTSVPLMEVAGTHLRMVGDTDEYDHDDHDTDGHGHDHTGVDPHAWLDPHNAMIWLPEIARQLADADPGNAALYRSNAEAALTRLAEVTAQVEQRLDTLKGGYVVYHDAYGYFSDRFHLPPAGTIADQEATPPGARQLAELREAAKAQDIRCLFTEPQFDPRTAQRLAEAIDVKVGLLDPVGSTLEPGPDLYFDLIDGLANALTDCLGDTP